MGVPGVYRGRKFVGIIRVEVMCSFWTAEGTQHKVHFFENQTWTLSVTCTKNDVMTKAKMSALCT